MPESEIDGVITSYYPKRAFGFIQDQDSRADYFFHLNNYLSEEEPRKGMKVRFNLGKFKGRTCAVNVQSIE